jgi:hypothetical protein
MQATSLLATVSAGITAVTSYRDMLRTGAVATASLSGPLS